MDVELLTAGDPVHLEGLCTSCWIPCLWRVEFWRISDEGLTLRATWEGCSECGDPGELVWA